MTPVQKNGANSIGRIRSKGGEALFVCNKTRDIKDKWSVPKGRSSADFARGVVDISITTTGRHPQITCTGGEDGVPILTGGLGDAVSWLRNRNQCSELLARIVVLNIRKSLVIGLLETDLGG